MKRLIWIVGLLGACTSAAPTSRTAAGQWSGTVPATSSTTAVDLTVVLADHDGAVTGSGTAIVGGYSDAITVSGARSDASLSLTFVFSPTEQASFSGDLVDDTHIDGTFDGIGAHGSLVLAR